MSVIRPVLSQRSPNEVPAVRGPITVNGEGPFDLGVQSREVLRCVGLSEDGIDTLIAAGVVQESAPV